MRRIVRCAVPGALFLLGLSAYAMAQEKPPDFDMAVTAGFRGYVQEAAISPVHVRVQNNTAKPFQGKLVLSFSATGSPSSTAIPVSLPPQSRRKYELPMNLSRGARPSEVTVRLVADSGGSVLSRLARLRVGSITERLMLASEEEDLAFVTPVLPTPENFHAVRIRTEEFPESWRTYGPVFLCAIGDQELSRLTEKQLQALIQWTLQGGWLVVKAGRSHEIVANSPLSKFLPVTIHGTEMIDSFRSFTDVFEERIDFEGKMPVTRATMRSGRVLLASDSGLPLMASRPVGRGQVTAILFDLDVQPIKGLEQRPALWETLIRRHRPEIPSNTFVGQILTGARNAFSEQIKPSKFQPLPLSLVMPYLLLYLLIVGPLDYWLLRWLRKQEWTWIFFVATTLLFTATAFVWIYETKKGSAQFDRFSITMHYPQDGWMQGRVLANLYSQENRYYAVGAPPDGWLKRLSEPASRTGDDVVGMLSQKGYELEEGTRLVMRDVYVPIWTNEQFQYDTYSLDTVLNLRLQNRDGQAVLSGANPYPFSIHGWVVTSGRDPLRAVIPARSRFDSVSLRDGKIDSVIDDVAPDARYRAIVQTFRHSLTMSGTVFIGLAEENPMNVAMADLSPKSKDLAVFIVELTGP